MKKKKKGERGDSLSLAQKQLVEFMVLYPGYLGRLEEYGIRECLAGGIGEVLYLQLRTMLEDNSDFEPEELLTALPEGAERKLVAELLARPSLRDPVEEEEEGLGDMLAYLKMIGLQQDSDEIMARIKLAESEGDHEKLQQLIAEKVEISRRMQG